LIVDDNSMLRETTRSILESRFPRLRVFEAGDGQEACAQIHSHVPDLILMDVRLPGDNGIKLTRKIKNLYPKVLIIIFTDYDLPEYREAAFENGADFFVSKSMPNEKKLTAVVESMLTTDPGSNHP
jgi:DNA-binding NarL/FixJ family response regulator